MFKVTGNSTEEGVVGEAGGGMEWATGHSTLGGSLRVQVFVEGAWARAHRGT